MIEARRWLQIDTDFNLSYCRFLSYAEGNRRMNDVKIHWR